MHAEITAYKGKIIFNLKVKHSIQEQVLTSQDNKSIDGHVIIDTKNNLGISKEAIELLKKVMKSKEGNGQLDWSKNALGKDVFGWKGLAQDIRSPEFLMASKKYKLLSFQDIPNNVPEGARQAIDKMHRIETALPQDKYASYGTGHKKKNKL